MKPSFKKESAISPEMHQLAMRIAERYWDNQELFNAALVNARATAGYLWAMKGGEMGTAPLVGHVVVSIAQREAELIKEINQKGGAA